MKKIVIILGLCLFCGGQVWAEETAAQTVENNQAYATLNFQKQPKDDKQKQGISNHFTFFTINVQVNGKLKDPAENVN